MKLTLIKKTNQAKDAISFVFKADKNFKWTPGQYLIYTLDHTKKDLRGKQRFFTISSSPFQKNPTITTRIFAKNASSFKKKLNSLKIGDTIKAKGPDGDFVLNNVKKTYVFIAGGIGITPFISMLRQLNHEQLTINATLLYSNKNEPIFKNELNEIAKRNPKLKIHFIFSPKRIDRNLLKKFINKKTMFYVSGPDPMVYEITKILEGLKVPKENIKEDYFSGLI